MNARAQSSVEMVVILAVGVTILLVLVDFTSTQFNKVQLERADRTARATMDQLVGAINAVYTQGPGAVRQVSVIWPDGIDASFSQISGHSIRIRVNSSDVVGTTVPNVTGNFPTNPGPQLIRVQAYDGFVSLGTLLLDISPTYVLTSSNRDENKTVTLTVSNHSQSLVGTMTYTLDWNSTDVNAVLNTTNPTLGPNRSVNKDVNFSVGHNAVGTYTGTFTVQAAFGSAVETQVIPLTLDVRVGTTSPLSIFPSTISITGFAGDVNMGEIEICNLGSTSVSGITFTPSTGNAGDWVQGVPDVNTIAGQSCVIVDVNAAIPSSAGLGANAGSVFLQDYSGSHVQNIPLSVTVKGMGDAFVWDWNGASIGSNNVSGFILSNVGNRSLQISQIQVSSWWSCDSNQSNLSLIRFNNVTRFSGQSADGNTMDVTDFNIPVLTSWTDNALVFSGIVNDENEQFSSVITFVDGTSATTSTFGPGC